MEATPQDLCSFQGKPAWPRGVALPPLTRWDVDSLGPPSCSCVCSLRYLPGPTREPASLLKLPLLTKSMSISCAAASAAWGSRGTLPSHPLNSTPVPRCLELYNERFMVLEESSLSMGIFKNQHLPKKIKFPLSLLSIVLSGR